VIAIRSSKKQDPESVTINVFEVNGRVTFCTLYPSRPGDPPNTCDERGNTSHSSSNSDVEVSYRVKVPAGVTLEARTVNGDVEASGNARPGGSSTVNGEIRIATTSWAEASTVNGGVAVAMSASGWPDGLDFRTVNGSIVLDFSGAPNADLRAETMHGEIDSEFPLQVQGRCGGTGCRGDSARAGRSWRSPRSTARSSCAARARVPPRRTALPAAG
jgi:hypothetical protein